MDVGLLIYSSHMCCTFGLFLTDKDGLLLFKLKEVSSLSTPEAKPQFIFIFLTCTMILFEDTVMHKDIMSFNFTHSVKVSHVNLFIKKAGVLH